MSAVAAVDSLEAEIRSFLDEAERTGNGDVRQVVLQLIKVQLALTDVGQRVSEKSILLEDESRRV